MIACLKLPALSLLAALRRDPALREKPLVLGDPEGVVVAAAAVARRRGVVSGMSLKHAEQCCPDAIIQPVDAEATAQVRRLLLATLYRITPEVACWDDDGYAFMDWRGLRWRWPDRSELFHTIEARVREVLHTRPALGIADTLFSSRLAADRASVGHPKLVEDAPGFLRGLPIRCLPLDEDQLEYVELLGLRTIGDLQRIPRVAFRRQFGVKRQHLHDLAWGIDPRTIPPWHPPSQIEESIPLEPPLEDTEALQFVVRSLIDRIAELLLAGGLGAREIAIRLDLDGAPPVHAAVRYAYPLTTGADLFDRIRGRLKLLRPSAPLERITLSVRHVEPAYVRQPGLLLRRDGLQETLADAISRLQEETRHDLVQRVTLVKTAPPVIDRRARFQAVTP